MRNEMLTLIHSSHLGIEKCQQRAKDVIYWPGMGKDIALVVSSCSVCNKYRYKNTKEPLLPHSIPDRPWSKVGADLFEIDSVDYLLLVDYYSGFF